MCIRVYLNGDGIGYKTHLCAFFVLMRRELSPLLKCLIYIYIYIYRVERILMGNDTLSNIVQQPNTIWTAVSSRSFIVI